MRIDPKGIFKYILIEGKSNAVISRYVRGSVKYEYHAQNFVAFKEELEQLGYKIEGYNK